MQHRRLTPAIAGSGEVFYVPGSDLSVVGTTGAGSDGGDIIELLLDVRGGDLAASFGGRALAVFFGEFETDDAFATIGFTAPARVEISARDDVAPIPLPAGGLLLLSGLALIGLRRRR